MSLKLNSNSINYNVATVLDLTSIVSPSINDTVVVTEEGRGGVFIYRADGTSNGGTIFDSSGAGKWHRQYEGSVNVKWFGAKGDGIVDDTAAIQSAINSTGNIFIPSGTFKITNKIDALKSSNQSTIQISGSGHYSKIILNGAEATLSFVYNGGVDDKALRVISDVYFSADITVEKIITNSSVFLSFKNVVFDGGKKGYYTDAGYNTSFDSCQFKNSTEAGTYLLNSTTTIFNNCYWRDLSTTALSIYGSLAENFQFNNCTFEGIRARAIYIDTSVLYGSLLFNSTYFELTGDYYANIPSVENLSAGTKVTLSFTNSKFSNNDIEGWKSGKYILGKSASIDSSVISGYFAVDTLSLTNNKVEDALFIATTEEPTRLVLSKNNIWGKGINDSSGYCFDIGMQNISTNFRNNEIKNRNNNAFAYPMNIITDSPASLQNGEDKFLQGNTGKVTFAGSIGGWGVNSFTIGAFSGTNNVVQIFSIILKAEVTKKYVLVASGDGNTIAADFTLFNGKQYRLVAIGNRQVNGTQGALIYSADTTAGVLYCSGVYSTTISGENINYYSFLEDEILSGNISYLNNTVSDGNSIPTVGSWLRGDVVRNMTPSASSYIGWVCTTSGTPGTWKGFGLIQA